MEIMKKSFYYLIVAALLSSCGFGGNGELVGSYPREEWEQVNPYGMNYIHFGSFTMGPSDQDVPYALNSRAKTVTLPAFYIDQTEITNNEYRQFIDYVRDSLIRDRLAQDEIDMEDDEVFELIYPEFFLQGSDKFYDRQEIDTRKLSYSYWWIDFKSAAVKEGKDEEYGEVNSLNQLHSIRGHSDRSRFIIQEKINVYPDTLVWVHDFTYGFNEPLTENYFWHPAYDDYPVVGVTWGQCQAFCAWRSQIMDTYKQEVGETFITRFRLPSEAEWEFAARGGLDLAPYPWGGPYIRNNLGCPLANFKPMRGDYVEDNGCYTVPVDSYSANDYGLFCMAGNVSEWTNTAYDESVYEFTHDMSPEYDYRALADDAPSMKRKVIRGGSWKDIGYFIQTGTRSFEYQDTAKSYIGFRCALSYLGRGKNVAPENYND
jgi:sulfatase modifying factor 1